MKQKRIITSSIIGALMLSTLSTTALASSKPNTNVEYSSISDTSNQPSLSQDQINKLDKYVYFDSKDINFKIKDDAKNNLTMDEYTKLEFNIKNTNQTLKSVDLNGTDEVNIIDSQNTYKYGSQTNRINLARSTYKEGVNTIKYNFILGGIGVLVPGITGVLGTTLGITGVRFQ